MNQQEQKEKRYVSPIGRAIYCDVFDKRIWKNSDKDPVFELTLAFETEKLRGKEKERYDQLNAVIMSKSHDVFGKKLPNNFWHPIRNDNPRGIEFLDGDGVVHAKFKCGFDRLDVLDAEGMQPITKESGLFYPGCYARVSWSPYIYKGVGGGNGCRLNMYGVLKVADGDEIETSSGSTALNDFAEFASKEDVMQEAADMFG